ncbi:MULTISPECIES: hypothetical protein [Nocardia]|nr:MULTISPECIES: hypothetical protein [Nocardia]
MSEGFESLLPPGTFADNIVGSALPGASANNSVRTAVYAAEWVWT